MHGAIGGGYPPGVTEADISGRPVRTTTCDCGCGAVIREGEECYMGDCGEVFADMDCVRKYYGVRYGHCEGRCDRW